MRDINRLARQAASQQGLLSTHQLRALGITSGVQRGLVRHGILEPRHRGVYCVFGFAGSWMQDLWAAVLAPGPAKTVSHRSALRLAGLRTVDDHIEVSVRYPAQCQLAGVTVHRSVDLRDEDVSWILGLPVTSIARMLCDAGLIFPESEIQRMVDHAVATGLVTPAELLAFRRRVGEHGRNGVIKLENAVAQLPVGAAHTESGGEVSLLRLIAGSRLPTPTLQYPVSIGSHSRRIDIAYPDAMLAIEYDGREPHLIAAQFEDDRRRQNQLVLSGWTVLRFTNNDVKHRPAAVIRQIAQVLDSSLPAFSQPGGTPFLTI